MNRKVEQSPTRFGKTAMFVVDRHVTPSWRRAPLLRLRLLFTRKQCTHEVGIEGTTELIWKQVGGVIYIVAVRQFKYSPRRATQA